MTAAAQPAPGAFPPVPEAPDLQRYHLLGSWLDDYTVPTLLQDIAAAAATGRPWLIANHNVNSLALMQTAPAFRDFFRRPDRIFIDGTGVLGLAKLLGHPLHSDHRVAVLDWIWPLCALAEEQGWRLAHLGGSGSGLRRARAAILARHPGLDLVTVDGFFDVGSPAEVEAVLSELRLARPTVLLVGMGMPRQELWLDRHLADLPSCVVITVGGILSFVGGERPTPPRWLGRLGLEWLYRLATEPRRLWRRYLLEPWHLLPAVLREVRGRLRSSA
jgi:N-acetylglucosaminyldiphosphoundecaprenol N-acetyl-beta-D-mannosaminyltransferase